MKKSVKYNILCLVIIAVTAVIYLFKIGGEEFIFKAGDTYPVVLSLLSIFGLYSAFRSFKQWDIAKTTWMLILAGTIIYFIAECSYFYLEIIQGLDADELFPTAADIFWCAGYVFYVVALFNMIIYYLKSGMPLDKWKTYLVPAGILFVIIVCVMYVFLLNPIAVDEETGALDKFFYFYYPIGDLLIIFPAFFLMYVTHLLGSGMFSRPWRIIAYGFIIMTIADLAYSYLDWQGTYQTGNMIDLLWGIGYWLIGLSGIYQNETMETIKKAAEYE